jgi:hypothetical protein
MTDSESEDSSSSSDSDSECELVKKTSKPMSRRNSTLIGRHFESNRNKAGTINGGERVTDGKSDDASRKKQNEEMTARTTEEATSEQCTHGRADHVYEAQSADRQGDGDTVARTNEKQPTKRKSRKETQNEGKQPTTDQHVHDAVSGNNGRRAFSNYVDKTVTTLTAAKEKSSQHVERGIQTTPCMGSITLDGFHKSTESSKSRARRARRQRSKSRLAAKRRAS